MPRYKEGDIGTDGETITLRLPRRQLAWLRMKAGEYGAAFNKPVTVASMLRTLAAEAYPMPKGWLARKEGDNE